MSLRKLYSRNSKIIYLYAQEMKQRWQKACTDEQGAPVKIKM